MVLWLCGNWGDGLLSFFSARRRRHTKSTGVDGVQTCALRISQLGRQRLQGKKYGEGGSWGVKGLLKFQCIYLFLFSICIAFQTDPSSVKVWGEARCNIWSYRGHARETIALGTFPTIPTG